MKVKKARGQRGLQNRPSYVRRIQEAWRTLMRILLLLIKPIRQLPWWADVVGLLAFGYLLYQITNSLTPVVQPDTAISSSYKDLPITVKNTGDLFEIRDAQFFCDLTEQQFSNTDEGKRATGFAYYKTAGLIEWPIRQQPTTIEPGNAISFPCNIAENTSAKSNDTPLPLKLIRLSVKTQYSTNFYLFRWHRQTQSQTFTWSQVSGGWQWLPGETMKGPG